MLRKTLLLIATATLLAACGNDSANYTVTDEHCQPQHWKTLPDNADREALVEKCMSR
ncbi:entry exclusion lipoprotein TrbK [Pseudomonas hunanensis]|uniref:Entry exclusion lipoprotein TrbK n=1 Tax=Pseudomonas hunanensis TaxID=1247546 RepID=A0ACC6JYP8_9PSED|nr:entry exclusion lipoprotein TrbK [Pseudomonas hunanensis]MDR6711241.1 entry exclusion lipoprotein TrbK [Pseudomonas hunanensis]